MIADRKYGDGVRVVPLENNAVTVIDGAAQKSFQSPRELVNFER
jgi:hypothetical protein